MSVQNAGTAIREARLKAGLSQEKLSDGICSVLSLSRIENGTAGVSPSTFQALMAHAGAPCEAFPIFANRTDFDCFYTLKRARFYLDSWQLNDAFEELEKIEQMNFAKNKYYYQEWLFLQCKLQFRSGLGNHANIYDTLLGALHISRPEFDFVDFRSLLLSITEIEILISLAQEALYLNNLDHCLEICTQISSYLENSQITFIEKEFLLAENAVVYAKYLIAIGDYNATITITDKFHNKMAENSDDAPIHELTFLSGLAYHYQNNIVEALLHFKTAFFSAHSIQSCYATICRNYLLSNLKFDLPTEILSVPDIPLVAFEIKKIIDLSDFSDGTYDLFSSDTLTIGALIRELRLEQNITQQILCYGLCSKSKLSKIENGSLQPDIALAQSLLQRLGISDSIFTFYGNNHETLLQDLRQKLTTIPLTDTTKVLKYSQDMLNLCNKQDTFYTQYALYRKACCIKSSIEGSSNLFDTLTLSLEHFEFNNISNYRLSWLELTILNNYCAIYSLDFPSKGIFDMYKLLEYYHHSQMDVLEKKRVFPVTLTVLVRHLYKQKRFNELIELSTYFSSSTVKFTVAFSAFIFCHYSQALAEVGDTALATLYAHYTYYNFLIINSLSNATGFKDDFKKDYNILLS